MKTIIQFWIVNGLALCTLATISPTRAQIVPDATLPNNSNVTAEGNISVITGGTAAGSNLFHSFEQFSLLSGSAAYFNNATDIQNIISRVTGASISNIDGLIRANGTANLFLINPNGIIFGPNATLNIGGSFLGSTATSLNFVDGTQFSATAHPTTPLLTVSVPIGLQFTGTAGSIVNQSQATNSNRQPVGLRVPSGRSLALVGGDVRLDGGRLLARGGRVELGGLAGAGTVGLSVDSNNLLLSFPDDVARADVSLTNNGSNIARAEVAASTSNGGSIGIAARNVDILGDSELLAGIARDSGFSGAEAGDIEINATGVITVAGRSSGIRNTVNRGATGDAGDINITTGSLLVTNGANLTTTTNGQGNAGDVRIRARDTVSFVGEITRNGDTRAGRDTSRVGSSVDLGEGNAGNVDITTRSLSLTDGANLTATSLNQGDGGNINIKTGSLSVTNGAQLNTSTQGRGDAGDVTIDATDTVIFDGVGRFEVFGEVTFNRSQAVSRVNQRDNQPITVGNGGNIKIKTGSLIVRNGAQLNTSTEAQGNAGKITIDATDTVVFDGQGIGREGEIFSRALSDVRAGGEGNAGNINITASSIRLENRALLSSNTIAGQEGNIILRSKDLVLRRGSEITTNATGAATGGNITIDAGVIVALEDSDITANAGEEGGRVIINTQSIFGTEFRNEDTSESDITASSERGREFSGTVEINTPEVDPSQGLVTLPAELINASNQIATGCAADAESVARNEFIVTGRGGLPPTPTEALRSDSALADLGTPIQGDRASAASTNLTNSQPVSIVEAQGWIIGPQGEVVLTADAPSVTPHSPWMASANCHALENSS